MSANMRARSASDELLEAGVVFMIFVWDGSIPALATGLDLELPGMRVPGGDAAFGIQFRDKQAVHHVAEGGGHPECVLFRRFQDFGFKVEGDVLAGAACSWSGHGGRLLPVFLPP